MTREGWMARQFRNVSNEVSKWPSWMRKAAGFSKEDGQMRMTDKDTPPRTVLGRKLRALRQKAIAAGMRLLTEDEVLDEVRRRRGEQRREDTQ